MKPVKFMLIVFAVVIFVSACKPTPAPLSPTATSMPPAATSMPSTATPVPPTETPIPPTPTPASPLSPEPQEITFQASDGQTLTGLYYPAAVNPAPVVVFMHWVRGNQTDWYEIAVWLQNRGLVNPFPVPAQDPWWDPSWFPPVPANRS